VAAGTQGEHHSNASQRDKADEERDCELRVPGRRITADEINHKADYPEDNTGEATEYGDIAGRHQEKPSAVIDSKLPSFCDAIKERKYDVRAIVRGSLSHRAYRRPCIPPVYITMLCSFT